MLKEKILLHICCGPCAIFPLEYLQKRGFEVTVYFYNPNIHPYKEYQRRLETVKIFCQDTLVDAVLEDSYQDFEEMLKFMHLEREDKIRCFNCYEWRLKKTLVYAKNNNFTKFTTSLLVSPYQKHELIKKTGEEISQDENVEFFYYDMRSGWSEAVKVAKERDYYRQPYCGCIFSEKERYYKKNKKI